MESQSEMNALYLDSEIQYVKGVGPKRCVCVGELEELTRFRICCCVFLVTTKTEAVSLLWTHWFPVNRRRFLLKSSASD